MAYNPQAPATKQDLAKLATKQDLKKFVEKRDLKLFATKDDISMLMIEIGKLYDANARWKDELILQLDFKLETVRHDVLDALNDSLENLKIRLTRLEQK